MCLLNAYYMLNTAPLYGRQEENNVTCKFRMIKYTITLMANQLLCQDALTIHKK